MAEDDFARPAMDYGNIGRRVSMSVPTVKGVLTPQELAVLVEIAQSGDLIAVAASRLGMPCQTAKNHLSAAYSALHVRGMISAFIALGWLTPILNDRERTRCSSCCVERKWYELEPGSGRCEWCRP